MVHSLYDLILYPLIKLAFYIMISILFIILLLRIFSFVSSTAEEVRTKSMQIIISCSLGLLVLISSRQLVEGIYGKEDLITNNAAVSVTDIGSSFLSDANIPIIYDVIKRTMGIS
jgi:hypothetical protein